MAENLRVSKHTRIDLRTHARYRLRDIWRLIRLWHQRRRSRRLLATLPSHLLKDIGVNEATRFEELRKPFWRE